MCHTISYPLSLPDVVEARQQVVAPSVSTSNPSTPKPIGIRSILADIHLHKGMQRQTGDNIELSNEL